MSKIDRELCLSLLRLAIQPSWHPPLMRPDFLGSAKNWDKFKEPAFQAFTKEHDIGPDTIIAIWDQGNDNYEVKIRQYSFTDWNIAMAVAHCLPEDGKSIFPEPPPLNPDDIYPSHLLNWITKDK